MPTDTKPAKRRTNKPRDRRADLAEIKALLPGIELAIQPGRPQHTAFLRLLYTQSEYNARMILAQTLLCKVAEVSDLRKHPYWKSEMHRFVKHDVRGFLISEPATRRAFDEKVPDPTRDPETHPDPWIYLRYVYVFDVSQTVEREEDR
jgi:hypothetical protein